MRRRERYTRTRTHYSLSISTSSLSLSLSLFFARPLTSQLLTVIARRLVKEVSLLDSLVETLEVISGCFNRGQCSIRIRHCSHRFEFSFKSFLFAFLSFTPRRAHLEQFPAAKNVPSSFFLSFFLSGKQKRRSVPASFPSAALEGPQRVSVTDRYFRLSFPFLRVLFFNFLKT